METIIRLKASEINLSFFNKLKNMLDLNDEIKILINTRKKSNEIFEDESIAEMRERIDRSIEDAENESNLISFTEEEFEEFSKSIIEQ
jgi:hypothetical protein